MAFQNIIDFLTGPYSYFFFFLAMFFSGMGVPLNADLTMLVMGVLSGVSPLHPLKLLGLAVVGINAGDSVIFFVSKTYGLKVFRLWPFYLFLNKDKFFKLKKILTQHGPKMLFIVRFLPGTRTLTIFSAGLFRMNYLKFIKINSLAVSLLASLLIFGGNLLFSSIQQAKDNLHFVLLGILVFASICYFISRWMIQRQLNLTYRP